MADNTNPAGWNEWARFVLMSLEELKKQYAESEDKIDNNKDTFIQALNGLELTVVKEIGNLTTEIKMIKKQMAIRSMAWSSIVPAIGGIIVLILKILQ